MILFDNYPLAMQQWWSGGVEEWWNGVATNQSRKPHFHSRQSVNYTLARSRQKENYTFLHSHNQQFRIFQTKIPQNKKYLKTDRYRVFWAEAESVKVYAFSQNLIKHGNIFPHRYIYLIHSTEFDILKAIVAPLGSSA